MDKSVATGASFANGNAPNVISKTQRDSGFNIRSESSWTMTVLPAVV